MNRQTTLLALSFGLLVFTFIFIFFGCSCSQKSVSVERFEVNVDPLDSSELSSKEQELFQDLISNKLSTDQITDLVKGGVLTQKMVEKFLQKLDVNMDSVAETPKDSYPQLETFGENDEVAEDFAGFDDIEDDIE